MRSSPHAITPDPRSMGFQAILPSGELIAPAVDVLEGKISPQRANDRYRRITGTCPHCQQLRDSQIGTDNARIQAALSVADLTVHYRSASLDRSGAMIRIMHFAHRPGFLKLDGACLLCRSADLTRHAAGVKVIGRWCEKHWPGSRVVAEMQIVVPGAPPETFRPDISVHAADGTPIACIEYQRSAEPFEAFLARDQVRRKEFPDVRWFFSAGVYARSRRHREYLADGGRDFYYTRIDPESGRLLMEDGAAPVWRTPQVQRDPSAWGCSESSLLRAMRSGDDDQPASAGLYIAPQINTSLEMQRRTTSRQAPSVAAMQYAPMLTVSERVALAWDAGCRSADEVVRWDASRNSIALRRSEAAAALKRRRS